MLPSVHKSKSATVYVRDTPGCGKVLPGSEISAQRKALTPIYMVTVETAIYETQGNDLGRKNVKVWDNPQASRVLQKTLRPDRFNDCKGVRQFHTWSWRKVQSRPPRDGAMA